MHISLKAFVLTIFLFQLLPSASAETDSSLSGEENYLSVGAKRTIIFSSTNFQQPGTSSQERNLLFEINNYALASSTYVKMNESTAGWWFLAREALKQAAGWAAKRGFTREAVKRQVKAAITEVRKFVRNNRTELVEVASIALQHLLDTDEIIEARISDNEARARILRLDLDNVIYRLETVESRVDDLERRVADLEASSGNRLGRKSNVSVAMFYHNDRGGSRASESYRRISRLLDDRIENLYSNVSVDVLGENWQDKVEYDRSILVYITDEGKSLAYRILQENYYNADFKIVDYKNSPYYGLGRRDLAIFVGSNLIYN